MDGVMRSVIELAQRHAPREGRAALVDPDLELQAAGLTSLELVGFILDLEQRFEITIGDALMQPETFRSVRTITRAVAGLLGASGQATALQAP